MNYEAGNRSTAETQESNASGTTVPGLSTTHVDVLETSEVYKEVEGDWRFSGVLVVYREGNNTYHAISKARFSPPLDLSKVHLNNKMLIPPSAYSPPFSPIFTRAIDPLPDNIYIKRPSLTSYNRVHDSPQPNSIADGVLSEARVYELLKQNPHPNIAKYHGCQVSGDRIDGICLSKYDQTLMKAVNPRSFGKRKFSATRNGLGKYGQVLDEIEGGINHLHSLGLVHNDLNPSNIMIDGDTPVIIDFGSCCRPGESLDNFGRTYEWFDESVETAHPKNDLDALREMRIWLQGGGDNDFQFVE